MDYIGTLREQLEAMAHGFVATLPSIAIALIVIIITWFLVRIFKRIARRLAGRAHLRPDLKQLIETLVWLGVWLVGIMIALAIVIPGLTPAGLIAGLGFGAVAIGFAFQDIFENFLAGVLIMLREKMQIGDLVETEGVLGKVEKISLRETHIRQFSGELFIMPNSLIFKNPVKVITDVVVRRNDIVVGVSYDTDLPKAEAAMRSAVEGLASVDKEKGVDIYAQEFNSSSVDFLVRWWTNTNENDYLGVKAEVVFAIKKALDDAEIEIPFPYVTHTFKEKVPVETPEDAANEAA